MKSSHFLVKLFVILGALLNPILVLGEEIKTELSLGRLKGEYRIAEISKSDLGEFTVSFQSTSPKKEFENLIITSRNLHIDLKINQVVQLSAEFKGKPANKVELVQVLIYLMRNSQQLPVWVMSSRHDQNGLRASKYIEMHAPATDYMVY